MTVWVWRNRFRRVQLIQKFLETGHKPWRILSHIFPHNISPKSNKINRDLKEARTVTAVNKQLGVSVQGGRGVVYYTPHFLKTVR